jgi:peptidoglycan biosynthesis protein MviN/MurJ (putative lipid II flippase)
MNTRLISPKTLAFPFISIGLKPRSTTAHGIALPFERAPVSIRSTTMFGKLLPLPVVIGVSVHPLVVLLYYRGKFAAVDVASVGLSLGAFFPFGASFAGCGVVALEAESHCFAFG